MDNRDYAASGEVSDPASGGCLCGSVRFESRRPLRAVVNCHCEQCRRFHGHYAAYTAVSRSLVTIYDNAGRLRWYRSSGKASRGFCANCGSSLFWDKVGSDLLRIAAGSLDQPTGLNTISHIHTYDQGDYYHLTDDLEKWPLGMQAS